MHQEEKIKEDEKKKKNHLQRDLVSKGEIWKFLKPLFLFGRQNYGFRGFFFSSRPISSSSEHCSEFSLPRCSDNGSRSRVVRLKLFHFFK